MEVQEPISFTRLWLSYAGYRFEPIQDGRQDARRRSSHRDRAGQLEAGRGTRVTGRRNTARRVTISEGKLQPLTHRSRSRLFLPCS